MFKIRQFLFFFAFTLSFSSARGQFSVKDRLLSGSFDMNYSNKASKVDAQKSNQFSCRFNPQVSFFTSAHFAVGFGLDAQYSHDNATRLSNNTIYTEVTNDIRFNPQLFGRYYHALSEKWYAAVQLQVNPISLGLSQWSQIYTVGQPFESNYQFQKGSEIRSFLTPLIGYRASKHWLIEGQLGNLILSINRTKSSESSYFSYFVSGDFNPTLFNFKGSYIWAKQASKSK